MEKKEARYIISIIGKGTNFEIPISDLKDFENLDGILNILKEKIQNAR
ncbi:hypothetical protein M0R72_04965 [Candidatus Pacearchaeota archaeon]|jgi:hypothetical protein|nr:hypothetical protein [Candidatus Pacearchaeota archaeon]